MSVKVYALAPEGLRGGPMLFGGMLSFSYPIFWQAERGDGVWLFLVTGGDG